MPLQPSPFQQLWPEDEALSPLSPPPSCVLPHRGADIKVFLAAVVEDLPQVPGAAKGMGEIFSLQAQGKKKKKGKRSKINKKKESRKLRQRQRMQEIRDA